MLILRPVSHLRAGVTGSNSHFGYLFQGLMKVIATGFIPPSPLAIVLAMVMLKSSQWLWTNRKFTNLSTAKKFQPRMAYVDSVSLSLSLSLPLPLSLSLSLSLCVSLSMSLSLSPSLSLSVVNQSTRKKYTRKA